MPRVRRFSPPLKNTMPIPPNRPDPRNQRAPSKPLVPTSGDAGDQAGVPVNPVSRAVHPREQFPQHFDFLMRDLFTRGLAPEDWQVIAADEVRLDEDGMDVEFSLLRTGTNQVWRRQIDVRHGRLIAIHER